MLLLMGHFYTAGDTGIIFQLRSKTNPYGRDDEVTKFVNNNVKTMLDDAIMHFR